jgi:hypothetical protein
MSDVELALTLYDLMLTIFYVKCIMSFMLESRIRYEQSGEVVAEVFVVIWRAMCAIARSFSLWFLCLFAWFDCIVADKHSLFGDIMER